MNLSLVLGEASDEFADKLCCEQIRSENQNFVMSMITTKELQAKIEEQKNVALAGTRHVFVCRQEVEPVQCAADCLSRLTQNPAQFEIHQFSGGQSPAQIARELASVCPRILVVAIADCKDMATLEWIKNSLPEYAAKFPFADLFYVDGSSLANEDRRYYESLGVVKLPYVLVFKMGHLVDSFAVQLQQKKASIMDQLADRDARIRADLAKKPPPVNIDDILRRGTDTGKDDYEQREREKAAQQARLEHIRQREERMRVRERIEAQRRARK